MSRAVAQAYSCAGVFLRDARAERSRGAPQLDGSRLPRRTLRRNADAYATIVVNVAGELRRSAVRGVGPPGIIIRSRRHSLALPSTVSLGVARTAPERKRKWWRVGRVSSIGGEGSRARARARVYYIIFIRHVGGCARARKMAERAPLRARSMILYIT